MIITEQMGMNTKKLKYIYNGCCS